MSRNRNADGGIIGAIVIAAACGAAVVIAAVPAAPIAAASDRSSGVVADDDPSLVGQWGGVIDWPAVAVHSILLKDGHVLWFRGDELPHPSTYVWDPLTLDNTTQDVESNIFCSGHSQLPDGRILVTGGALGQLSAGPPTAFIFDPDTSTWTREPDMRHGRFYPTNVALGDGRTVVVSGLDENSDPNPQVEIFVPGAGGAPDRFDLLEGAELSMDFYPRLHLLPSGNIVRVGPENQTMLLDIAAAHWSIVARSHYPDRDDGSSVMLPPGHTKIMIVGGTDIFSQDGLAMDSAEIIDMADPAPAWTNAASMHHHRVQSNAVILPDGKVLVSGGCEDIYQTRPVLPAEIYDPAANTWTEVASMTVPRLYHSSAILLPDARVLWAGANFNPTAEVYSPPYLFKGPRPAIRTAPAALSYGAEFRIKSPQARDVASIVLIRPGAATHAQNMEQRYVALTFKRQGGRKLLVNAPTERNIAPPGYYMMFLVDVNGIPSVARMVQVQ